MFRPCRTSRKRAEALALASLLLLAGCERKQRVSFVGDSITAAGRWQEAFPQLLTHNLGVPGDQAPDVLARLKEVKATRANLYVVMVGINDLRAGVPPGTVAAQIGEIRKRLRNSSFPHPQVVVLSTLQCSPMPGGQADNGCTPSVRAAVEQLNRTLQQQAPREFLDLNATMSPGGQLSRIYSEDGIHLSEAGQKRWQQLLKPLLREP